VSLKMCGLSSLPELVMWPASQNNWLPWCKKELCKPDRVYTWWRIAVNIHAGCRDCAFWEVLYGEWGCAKWWWCWWKYWALVRSDINVMTVLLCQQFVLPVVFIYHNVSMYRSSWLQFWCSFHLTDLWRWLQYLSIKLNRNGWQFCIVIP